MNRVKKFLKSIIILAFALVVLFEFGQWFISSEPDIIQIEHSPDGKYIAYVYESNGGATTGFCYHLTVLPKWIPLVKGPGNTWRNSWSPCKIEWINDRELLVDIYPSTPYEKDTHVWGVNIVYTN